MKERFIPKISTPKVHGASDEPSSTSFREAHAEGLVHDAPEKEISLTRNLILKKYSIPVENVLVVAPSKSKKIQRLIRAFSILINTKDPALNFYAEGHYAHAVLNKAMVKEFSRKVGVGDFTDLINEETMELKEPWVVKKGFLDPFHSGFQEFPSIRQDLIEQIEEARDQNGISEQDMHSIETGNTSLPNWFLSV